MFCPTNGIRRISWALLAVVLLGPSWARAQDVTTGESGSAVAGQADVDVDWTQDLSVATGTPLDVGGGWSATQIVNDEQFGTAPGTLNIFSPGVTADPGGIALLAGNEAHAIRVLDTATVQRVTGEAGASVILGGGQDWDFDYEDDNDNDAYDAGEDVLTGYGIVVAGSVTTPVDGGNTIEITDAAGSNIVFVEVEDGGTVTGNVVDSGGKSTLIDLMSENAGAGAMLTQVLGNVDTGAGDDAIIIEAVSDSGDPMTASGNSTAAITGNVVAGASTAMDELDIEAQGMTGNAIASIGGTVGFTGTADVQIEALSQGNNDATVTLTGLVTMNGPDNDLGIWLNHLNAGTGVSKVHSAAGITLGNGNTVEFTGAGNSSTVVYFNDAANGTGTNQALTGGTGADVISLSHFADGTLLMNINLSADGGADVVTLEDATLTGDVTFCSTTSNQLVSEGNDKIIGTVAANAALAINIAGPGLTVDGDIDINANTTLNRSSATGTLILSNASGGTGAIDVTGATFTITDTGILGAIAGGFTGTGTIAIQAGTMDEATHALADGLGVTLASSTSLTLSADQVLKALNGAGTLDAANNNLTLGAGTSSFTGTVNNLANLTTSGGTHTIQSDLTVNDLDVDGGLNVTGDVAIRAGAPRTWDLAAAMGLTGNLAVNEDTTLQGSAALTVASGGVTIAAGKTFTLADAARLASAGTGIGGTGTLLVQAGTLDEATVPLADGLTLDLTSGQVTLADDQSLVALLGDGTLNAAGNNLTLTTGTSTFGTGTLSNPGGLTVTGGTHTLGAISSPAGTVSVTGGTLNSGALTTTNPVSVTGGDYNITGVLTASNTVTANGGTLDVSSDFVTGADLSINLGSAVTVGGTTDINHNVTITKAAAGGSWTTTGAVDIASGKTLTLSDGGVIDSTTADIIGDGTLRIAGGSFAEATHGDLASTLGLTIDSGASAALKAAGGDQQLTGLNGAGSLNLNGKNLILAGGTSSFTGTLSNAANFRFDGGTHSLTIGTLSYGTGTATDLNMDNGTVTITTTGTATNSGDIDVDGGTLILAGSHAFGDNAGDDALVITGGTVKLLGSNTITGSVQVAAAGKLYTDASGVNGAAGITVQPTATIGAATSAGMTFDASGTTDLSNITAGNGFVIDATEGDTTVTGWTTPDAAGNYGVTASGSNKAILHNLATTDHATNEERIQISSGKVYLQGDNINIADEDFVEATGTGRLVINGTVTGTGTIQAAGGTLLYGPNYDLSKITSLDANSGVDAAGSNVTLTAATVTITGGAFDGGGEIEIQNTADFDDTAPTLDVGSATTVKIKNVSNLGGKLTKSGAGTLELTADAGDEVEATGGTIRLASGGGATNVTAGTGATVELKSGSTVTGDVTATGSTVKLEADVIGGKLAVNDAVIEPENDVTLDDDVEITATKAMTVSKKTLKITGTTSVPGGGAATVKAASGAKVEFAGDVTGVTGLTLGDGSAGGTVAINGTNGVDGDVTVDGVKLMGVGPIDGNLTVTSGTHSPGNSIGTQTISSGNYVLSNGAVLEIEIDADAGQTADLIDVTAGDATLQSGSIVRVIQADGTINTGDTFKIIEVSGTMTDSGATVESTVTTQFAGSVSGTQYILTATTRPFVDLAVGSNQTGIAQALDDMGSNALTTALGALPESQFASGVEQINAAPHIAAVGNQVQTITSVNGHVAGRLASLRAGDPTVAYAQTGPVGMSFAHAAQDPDALSRSIAASRTTDASRVQADVPGDDSLLGWSPFVKTYGTFAEQDSTSDETGFNADTVGFLGGFDRKFGEMTTLGLMVGYSFTDVDYDRSRGEADVHSLRVGPYASMDIEQFFVDVSLTMGYHWNDVDRKVRVGSFNRTASSDYDAWDLSLYTGVGYDFQVGGFTVTPALSLQWVHYEQESFTESGAGSANLDVDAYDTDSLQHMLAVKVSRVYETGNMSIVPEVYLGWGHEYLEDDKVESKFVGQTTPFAFESDSDDRDSLLFGVGASFLLEDHTSIFLRWDGSCSSEDTSHTVSAGLRFEF